MSPGRILVALLVGFTFACLSVRIFPLEPQDREKPHVVQWIGWPVTARKYSGPDPGFYGAHAPPDILFGDSVEIGLRSDSVVVWRDLRRDSAGSAK